MLPRAPQSHYLILGIPADADTGCIRSAFRALAQVHHPDRAGPDATARFQRMVEAYDVLSDPRRRREYDQQQCEGGCAMEGQCPRPRAAPTPRRPERWTGPPRRPAVEPLDDQQTWFPNRYASVRPPLDRPPQHAASEPRGVLPLTRWEARRGGRFAVAFPFLRPCERCGGRGTDSPGICSSCSGSGRVHDAWSLTLALPPDLLDGDQLRCRVPWPDGLHRDLTIDVRVV